MATKPEESATTPADAAPAAPAAPAATEPVKPQEPVAEEKPKTEEPAAAPTEELKNLDISDKKTEEATAAVAAAPVPAPSGPSDDSKPAEVAAETTDGPVWPETPADHPLTKFYDLFEELVKDADHDEVYGVKLSKDSPFHTKLILQKFLRANQNDLEKAKQQLSDTLKWRKEFDPVKASGETFAKDRFEGLGFIIEVEGVPESINKKDIVTFNIYGSVKDNKKTFGDLDGFIRWRVGLMERSVQKLNLPAATKPIPNFGEGPDPYQSFQVHDYLQVSFLRQDPTVKAATKKTIDTLGRHYPETLSRKFFVNVPIIMEWVFTARKLLVAKETAKKFTVLSYGNTLATELGQNIPKEYGGATEELKIVGEGMKLEDQSPEVKQPEDKPEDKKPEEKPEDKKAEAE